MNLSQLMQQNQELTLKIDQVEEQHKLDIEKFTNAKNDFDLVLSKQVDLQYGISQNSILEINQSLKQLEINLTTDENYSEKIYSLEEKITELENYINRQQQQYYLDKETILSEHEIALKQLRAQERFDYQSKLGARELDLQTQIDDLNEQLSKEGVKINQNQIDYQLHNEMNKRLQETQDLVSDYKSIFETLKTEISEKNKDLGHFQLRNKQLEMLLEKNSLRASLSQQSNYQS